MKRFAQMTAVFAIVFGLCLALNTGTAAAKGNKGGSSKSSMNKSFKKNFKKDFKRDRRFRWDRWDRYGYKFVPTIEEDDEVVLVDPATEVEIDGPVFEGGREFKYRHGNRKYRPLTKQGKSGKRMHASRGGKGGGRGKG